MDTLVWNLVRDELRDGRPGPNDLATRAVLADALAENDNVRLAQALARWPRDRPLWRTPLYRKIEAAVRGPVARSHLEPLRQPRKLLLALIGSPRRGGSRWVSVDRNVGGPSDGDPFVIEMGAGYSSYYGLVWAYDSSGAYEAAQEAFPSHFYDEIDEEELAELDGDVNATPHPTKRGVWLVEDENANSTYGTIIERARRVVSARRLDRYGRTARLRTGELVEFVE